MNKATMAVDTGAEIDTDTLATAAGELNRHLLAEAQVALKTGAPLSLTLPINTTDCGIASPIAAEVAARYGQQGLPEGTISITFHGQAGTGLGQDNVAGIDLTLIGEAGDAVGHRMCGGQIVIRPSLKSQLDAENGPLAGDGALESAGKGNLFVAGSVGDYFARRNCGAAAVVEGAGMGACTAMSGGVVVVLGRIGPQFAAEMQGGQVFVLETEMQIPSVLSDDGPSSVRAVDEPDVELLQYLITRHVRLTGSVRGQQILDDWLHQIERFWKVAPKAVNGMDLTHTCIRH